jgi:hypothetical protein
MLRGVLLRGKRRRLTSAIFGESVLIVGALHFASTTALGFYAVFIGPRSTGYL